MPTVDSADEVALRAHLAFQVVLQEPAPAGGGDLGSRCVRWPADPQWVRPQDLTTRHKSWYGSLHKWTPSPSERDDCLVLAAPTEVQNRIPLMDDACPTAALVWALRRQGWRGIEALCHHRNLDVGIFDSIEAVKMKAYYQALYKLHRCLPLCSGDLPSRQPIRFYKLLLAGVAAEPGLGAKAYQAINDRESERAGKPLAPLADGELEDPAAPVLDGDSTDSDIAIGVLPDAPKPKRRKITGVPRVGGASGSGGGEPPPLDAEPPVIIVDPPPLPPPAPVSDSDSDVPIDLPGPPPRPDEGGGGCGGEGGDGARDDSDVEVDVGGVIVVAAPRRVRPDKPQWQDSIMGFKVRFDPAYVVPRTGVRFSPNWQIRCTNPEHGACVKKRGETPSSTSTYGPVEPLCYLHAWLDVPPAPGKTHSNTNPPMESVHRFAAAHGGALEDVLRRVKG